MVSMARQPLPERQQGLGKEIHRLRKLSGLSQEQLAERLGLSRKTISDWESGYAVPKDANLDVIESQMGISRQRAFELMGKLPDVDLTDAVNILKRAEAETDPAVLRVMWRQLSPGTRQAIRHLIAASIVEDNEQEPGANEA